LLSIVVNDRDSSGAVDAFPAAESSFVRRMFDHCMNGLKAVPLKEFSFSATFENYGTVEPVPFVRRSLPGLSGAVQISQPKIQFGQV